MQSVFLGIGIDDMFVLAQCWSNISADPDSADLSLPEKLKATLKHAGVSITVTTVTDVFAFGLGALSVRRLFILYYLVYSLFRKCLGCKLFVCVQHCHWELFTFCR